MFIYLFERMCGPLGEPTQQLLLIKAKDELEAWDVFKATHDDGWGSCILATFDDKQEPSILGSYEVYTE